MISSRLPFFQNYNPKNESPAASNRMSVSSVVRLDRRGIGNGRRVRDVCTCGAGRASSACAIPTKYMPIPPAPFLQADRAKGVDPELDVRRILRVERVHLDVLEELRLRPVE